MPNNCLSLLPIGFLGSRARRVKPGQLQQLQQFPELKTEYWNSGEASAAQIHVKEYQRMRTTQRQNTYRVFGRLLISACTSGNYLRLEEPTKKMKKSSTHTKPKILPV